MLWWCRILPAHKKVISSFFFEATYERGHKAFFSAAKMISW